MFQSFESNCSVERDLMVYLVVNIFTKLDMSINQGKVDSQGIFRSLSVQTNVYLECTHSIIDIL